MLKNIMNKMNKKKKKGFTLIELIIVIAIIAILAAIALPKFMQVRETANVKSDLSNAKNIQTIVATLVSADDIDISVVTDFEVIAGGATDPGQLVLDQLQDVPVVKASALNNNGGNFYVTISGTDIKVYSDSAFLNLVYPDGADPY